MPFSVLKRSDISGTRSNALAEPVRIGIVDDHAFIRDIMQRLLARQKASYEVVCAVGTIRDALNACAKLQPDVLVLDINLPDRSGIDALPDLKRVAPHSRILLCSAFPVEESITDLVRSGADGFAEKTNSWADFLGALQRVSRGEKYFSATPSVYADRRSRQPIKISAVTRREAEIIRLIATGLTSKEIASRLSISAATVETHRKNLMAKTRVRNVAELVSRYLQGGFGMN